MPAGGNSRAMLFLVLLLSLGCEGLEEEEKWYEVEAEEVGVIISTAGIDSDQNSSFVDIGGDQYSVPMRFTISPEIIARFRVFQGQSASGDAILKVVTLVPQYSVYSIFEIKFDGIGVNEIDFSGISEWRKIATEEDLNRLRVISSVCESMSLEDRVRVFARSVVAAEDGQLVTTGDIIPSTADCRTAGRDGVVVVVAKYNSRTILISVIADHITIQERR